MTRPGDPIEHGVTFRGSHHRPAVSAAPCGPVRVVVLPTPVWPAPTAPEGPDPFVERRLAYARQRHAQVWFERHPGDMVR